MSIEEWRKTSTIPELDSAYTNAINEDSTKAAFQGQQETFIGHYQQFYRDLDDYLHANGFYWSDTTRCFNKIYFSASGRVEHYLFGFHGQLPPVEEKRFQELSNAQRGLHQLG